MKNKKTLLMPTNWFYPTGGCEVFVESIADLLAEEYNVVVAVRYTGKKKPQIKFKKAKLVEFKPWGGVGLISEYKPDIIFTNDTYLNVLGMLILARIHNIRALSAMRVVASKGIKTMFSWADHHFFKLYTKIFSYIAKDLLAPSEPAIKEIGIKKKIKVVEDGIDLSQFKKPTAQQVHALRKKYGIPQDKKVIIWVGRYDKTKNPRMFIEAASLDSNPNNLYVMAGFMTSSKVSKTKNPKDMLKKMKPMKNLKIIDYAPHDQVHELFQVADVFVSTTSFETYGLTILEAAACGLTTVVPKIGGTAITGRGGYFYEYSAETLAKKINIALKSPKKRSVKSLADSAPEYIDLLKNTK